MHEALVMTIKKIITIKIPEEEILFNVGKAEITQGLVKRRLSFGYPVGLEIVYCGIEYHE
jgi:hypothetical protein